MAATSLASFEPADYAVIAASGLTAILALVSCAYTVPWRCRGGGGGTSSTGSSPTKQAAARDFNVLWHGRATLSLLSAAWALSLLLRVSSLWGANSVVLPAGIRAWTGAGWMCRIYLTASLGLLHPFCAFTTLLMLTAALSRRHRPESLRHPNLRLLGQALLCTLPVAAVQAVIAWLGLVVRYQGDPVEASPRSLLGYFFATYWQGSTQQCGNGDVSGSGGGGGDCTLCTFPAAAAIAHAVFAVGLVCALCMTCSRLAAAVLNQRLKRRMRAFQASYSLLTLLGVAAVGTSIVWSPFSWANQACWLVFVGCSLLTVLLVEWEVVVWPVRDLRAVDKRLVLWADAFAAAAAEEAYDSRSSTGGTMAGYGSGSLIKAHGRSADAEAYVHAAAAARTLSVSAPQQQQQITLARSPPPQHWAPPSASSAAAAARTLSVNGARPAGGGPVAQPAWSSPGQQVAPPMPAAFPMPAAPYPLQQQQQQQAQAAAHVYTPASPREQPSARELLFP